jgi:glutamine synthetase
MNGLDNAREYVLRAAKENDVKFIRLWFTDILGSLKGFAITVAELEGALEHGMVFDGSSIAGFARVDENDMVAMPDPNTFNILPWRPRQNAVARMFCDILLPNGQPFEGDSRYILKQNLQRAADLGYTFQVAPEMEHFYFKNAESTEPLDHGGYFDLTPLDTATDLRRETVLTLEEMGIPVEYSHHEAATSQHEIDLRNTDALTMADALMTYRLVVKEVAMKHGAYATFMPKPRVDENGNGMHTNQSLFKGDTNAFYDPSDEYKLSHTAYQYVAGLLRHAGEITCVCCQWVNSYKRLVPGFEAPVHISWAVVNRSDLIRVPAFREGKESSVRIEYRGADPTCNPYLAFSVMMSAGLEGIEQGYAPVPPTSVDVAAMNDEDRAEAGIQKLPGSLYEAIELAEGSALLKKTMGDYTFDKFIQNKKIEWERYRSAVTDYEIKRYLPIL